MEEDDPSSALDHRAQLLQALISPLSFSTSKLSNKSRTIPHDRDFHFYNNFQEFKLPAKEISSKAQSSLQSLSSSTNLFGSKSQPPMPSDLDDSYDWLVNLNDEFIERFNLSLDEFKNSREKEESKSVNLQLQEGGFHLVNNRKKKGCSMNEVKKDGGIQSTRVLKEKAAGLKSRVPFHIPTIPRPQDEFNILVNNVNKPFEHVWLERSEDGSCVIHPLEKLSIMDFTDRRIQEDEIVKPLPLESTPFKLVEGVKELKALAAKLMDANEFAVDLEHNQYRSFQGLTCLMQISTRTEDFIVDTLKLRVHIGPYLREVFKDPSKRKVMHGADRDIEWLQRDFGIYICNLFDTGQASRVMQLERNSLEYLLFHFCGVHANKEYQNADWRLRPLPDEMIKYAREDTHYLLHIYDLMRRMLLSASSDENDLLLEDADFNSKQLAVADGLYQWRDRVAREEDESTGYILPNKALLEIAKQMPVSSGKLRRLVKSKNSVIERHLNTLTKTIRCQIEKSAKYESIAKQLQKARLEHSLQQAEEAGNDSEMVLDSDDPTESSSQKDAFDVTGSAEIVEASTNVVDDHANPKNFSSQISLHKCQQNTESMLLDSGCSSKVGDTMTIIEEQKMDNGKIGLSLPDKKAGVASVQIMKKQTCSFGALLGSSASRRKLNPTNGFLREQEKNVNKVEQIKSSVTLPFHSFSGGDSHSEPILSEINKQAQQEMSSSVQHSAAEQPVSAGFEEVIQLENNESDSAQSPGESLSADSPKRSSEGAAEELASLADLSSSFQQCFQSISQTTKSSSLTNKKKKKNNKQSQVPEANIEVKPFDYASARKNVNFGGAREGDELRVGDKARLDSREKQRGSTAGRADEQDRERGLRRQAFPASGNRSTSYK